MTMAWKMNAPHAERRRLAASRRTLIHVDKTFFAVSPLENSNRGTGSTKIKTSRGGNVVSLALSRVSHRVRYENRVSARGDRQTGLLMWPDAAAEKQPANKSLVFVILGWRCVSALVVLEDLVFLEEVLSTQIIKPTIPSVLVVKHH